MSDKPADPPHEKRVASEILPSVYEDLRKLAASKMAHEASGQTIGATALVHEAYLRIVKTERSALWESRSHFYSAAATAMRRILIDRARSKNATRHGGKLDRAEFDSINAPRDTPNKPEELLALDEALEELAHEEPRKARIVELRYFVGLSVEEVAEVMEISAPTVKRDWAFSRAWLHRAVSEKLQEPQQ